MEDDKKEVIKELEKVGQLLDKSRSFELKATLHDFEDILSFRREAGDLRWASRSWTPSKYFCRGQKREPSPRVTLEAILAAENVKRVLKEVGDSEGKSEKEMIEVVKSILTELSHDYHLFAIRWFAILLSKFGKKLYKSIQVDVQRISQIRETFKTYPVILLPTHRSYVDFLLISYIFFHYNLPLPIIAAGMDFMSMSGLAEMLRKSGAFFIRRKFGGDLLYWAIVTEYLKREILQGGHPIEMFVEGKRSRSAKSLPPKHGLLSAALDLVRTGDVQDILILPISISYDRTLEEKLYALELLGNPKPKESTNGLMKALRWLRTQQYGSIYVTFGEFLSTRQYLERHVNLHQVTPFAHQVQNIAYKVVLENQKNLIVPIFSLVSLIVLSKIADGEKKISIEEISSHLTIFAKLLENCGKSLGLPLPNQCLGVNIRYILHVHHSLVNYTEGSSFIILNDQKTINFDAYSMQFQHYANQILPTLFPFSIAIRLLQPKTINSNSSQNSVLKMLMISEQNVKEYLFLREIFAEDFLYKVGEEREELEWTLAILQSTLEGPDDSSTLRILAHSMEPYIMAYLAIYRSLLKLSLEEVGPFHMKQLERKAQEVLHQQMQLGSGRMVLGSLSLETLQQALNSPATAAHSAKIRLDDGSFAFLLNDPPRLQKTINLLGQIENWWGLQLDETGGGGGVVQGMDSHGFILKSKL